MYSKKILSISIAAFNVEEYINDTLSSLVLSEYIDYLDVLIIDDGSTDKTASIALEYTARYPDTFTVIRKKNGGYGSTINSALKHARGKYFKLLDGDDWCQKENMALFLAFLQQTDADMVLSEYQQYDCDANHPRKQHKLPYEPYIQYQIDKVQEIAMHELTVKTELVRERIRITENCYYTDIEWCLKAVLCCKTFVAVPWCIYCYRLGRIGQSVSDIGFMTHIDQHEYIMKNVATLINENPCLHGLKNHIGVLLLEHYYMRLRQKRTPANLKSLLNYRRFIIEEASYDVEYMSPKLRFLHSHPFLMLVPHGIMKILSKGKTKVNR